MSVLTPERTLPVPAQPTDVVAEPNTVKDQLLRAADLIEEHGHSQYEYEGPNGEICMMEALFRANGTTYKEEIFPRPTETTNALFPTEDWSDFSVCRFNNSHTKEECVAFLREKAATI